MLFMHLPMAGLLLLVEIQEGCCSRAIPTALLMLIPEGGVYTQVWLCLGRGGAAMPMQHAAGLGAKDALMQLASEACARGRSVAVPGARCRARHRRPSAASTCQNSTLPAPGASLQVMEAICEAVYCTSSAERRLGGELV